MTDRDTLKRWITLCEQSLSSINSLGRPIARSPADVANFWQWFGKSKIVNRQGQPIVVYHGTSADIRAFDANRSNSNTKTGVPHGAFVFTTSTEVAQSYAGQITKDWGFATEAEQRQYHKLLIDDDVEAAIQFFKRHAIQDVKSFKDGGNVMPVYLRMVKPLRVNAFGENWQSIAFDHDEWDTNHLMSHAKATGYDGLIVRNVLDRQEGVGKPATTYAVFSAAQIKSAIGNTGTFYPAQDAIHETSDHE